MTESEAREHALEIVTQYGLAIKEVAFASIVAGFFPVSVGDSRLTIRQSEVPSLTKGSLTVAMFYALPDERSGTDSFGAIRGVALPLTFFSGFAVIAGSANKNQILFSVGLVALVLTTLASAFMIWRLAPRTDAALDSALRRNGDTIAARELMEINDRFASSDAGKKFARGWKLYRKGWIRSIEAAENLSSGMEA